MRRFAPTLLLALPLVVVLVPEAARSTRAIDVTLSRYAFAPDRIEVRLGERVQLKVSCRREPSIRARRFRISAAARSSRARKWPEVGRYSTRFKETT